MLAVTPAYGFYSESLQFETDNFCTKKKKAASQ